MKAVLFFVAILLAAILLLISVGVGIGFVLHWLLPTIDIGIGALIGLIAFISAVQIVTRLMMSVPVEAEDEDVEVRDMKPSDVVYLVGGAPSKRRRKRKANR